MKYNISIFLIIFTIASIYSQYTEVINSNRPGSSQGAFSVGKNVLQFELGGSLTDLSHKNLNFSYIKEFELKYTIRYGLLMEKLELVINGSYNKNRSVNTIIDPNAKVINLQPMFPHSLNTRPLLVDESTSIKIMICDRGKAGISFDSHNNLKLSNGDVITIETSRPKLSLIHPTDHDFYEACITKLGWTLGITKKET